MSIPEILVLADGLVVLALLVLTLRGAKELYRDLLIVFGASRLRVVVTLLIAVSLLALFVVAALIVLVWKDRQLERFEHAVLLAGFLMSAAIWLIGILAALRGHRTIPILYVAGLLCALAPVFYLTPLGNFTGMFGQDGALFALAEGAVSAIACYLVLMRLTRLLPAL